MNAKEFAKMDAEYRHLLERIAHALEAEARKMGRRRFNQLVSST